MSKYYEARTAAESLYQEYCANTKAPRVKRAEPKDSYAEYVAAVFAEPVDYTRPEHCSVHPDYACLYANDE